MFCDQQSYYRKLVVGIIGWAVFFSHQLYAQQPVGELPGSEIMYEWNLRDSMHSYTQIKMAMVSSRENQDSAILVITNRVEESLRMGHHEAVFQGYFFLGVLYIYRGEYDVAYKWLWRALAYSEKSSRTYTSVCRILNNMGNIFQYRGDYRQALECYFKAIPFAENALSIDSGVASPLVRIYTSTAAALLQLKEDSRALYYMEKAERLAYKMDLTITLPAVYVNKAVVYARMGKWQEAWTYNQQALSVATVIADEVQFMALQNLGDILRENGKYRAAIEYLEAALRVKGNVNPYYKAGALSSLADCYFSMKSYKYAEQYFNLAYEKAKASGIQEHMWYVHHRLASLYEHTNNYRQAYEHRHAAYLLNDSLLNKDKMEAVNQLEVKYRTAESQKEVAQKQLLIKEQHRSLAQKNMWILATITGIAVLGALLLGFFRNYRQRQKLHAEQLRSMQQENEIELLQAMMQGEEKERIRFAHELHDGISSQLAVMKLYLDTIRVKNPALSAQPELDHVIRMLAETAGDVRKTAHNLLPDGLVRQGLEEAVRSFCAFVSRGNALQIEVQIYGDLAHLESGLALSVYRTIQELVHNILKHAHATQAIVLLNNRDDILYVTIEDNGTGMAEPSETGGLGLKSLQDRVQHIGGHMIIESKYGSGTAIYLELPVAGQGKQRRHC